MKGEKHERKSSILRTVPKRYGHAQHRGWLPNAQLSSMVSPMLSYVLPILIAYTGGKMVSGQRGAVMGAIACVGVICGAPDYPMLMGAMLAGPLGGWVIKQGRPSGRLGHQAVRQGGRRQD